MASEYHQDLINPIEGLQITMKTTSVIFKEPLEPSFHERFYGKNEELKGTAAGYLAK